MPQICHLWGAAAKQQGWRLRPRPQGCSAPSKEYGHTLNRCQMCGEKEVQAQVKLAFKSTGQAKMVITRSLLVTVKKTTVSMKTLDGTLTITKNGERSVVPKRVAELDSIMPTYLGVSKAVLDLVIFCHQDESLWPMSEPAPLKKKFDEIFEALKYTKALDNIKDIRKKEGERLKLHKRAEEEAKRDKVRADKVWTPPDSDKTSTDEF